LLLLLLLLLLCDGCSKGAEAWMLFAALPAPTLLELLGRARTPLGGEAKALGGTVTA
jgi:hypothetical protein